MKIGLVQMVCEKGALQKNLDTTASHIIEAVELGVDILVFPEASLSGYANPHRYPDAVVQLNSAEIARFLEMTRGKSMTVLAGILEFNPAGKPYISQVVARDGSIVGVQRKMTLGEEQQGRLEDWYSIGERNKVFTHEDGTFGIAICADLGNSTVFAECARQGADIVFEVAAPGLYGEQATRDWNAGFNWWKGEILKKLTHYSQKHHYWTTVATQAGRTVDEDFPGGAYVFSPVGECVFATPDGHPGVAYLEVDLAAGRDVKLL
jgi:predicted amidohydrolase